MRVEQIGVARRPTHMMTNRPLSTLLALLALLLVSCSGGGSQRALGHEPATTGSVSRPRTPVVMARELALPTNTPTDFHMQAARGGVLRSDGRCFRIGGLPIVWPHGYTARTDPLRVIDENGQVVARVGDRVRLGGGEESITPLLLASVPPTTRHCFESPTGHPLPGSFWSM